MKLTTLVSALTVAALAVGCNKNADQSSMGASTNQVSYSSGGGSSDTNVDNTKVNTRDRNNANLTPQDQGNSDADTKLSADIRERLESSTNNFSTAAKNVKIISQNGKVTLRGPVNTEAEKTQIDNIAKGVAGEGNVENDLDVKANQ